MHCRALHDAVNDVPRATKAETYEVEIRCCHVGNRGAVGRIVTRREQGAGVDAGPDATAECFLARRGQHLPRATQHNDRLATHRQVLVAISIPIRFADETWIAGGDPARQKGSDVQLLPWQEAIAQHDDDLRVEADRFWFGGVVVHDSSVVDDVGRVLYVSCMVETARTWHPDVPLVREVLSATFEQHAYPAHTHDAWTVLVIEEGAVQYTLHKAKRRAIPGTITLLPPHVPHDGRSASSGRAFRKKVLYLEEAWLPPATIDAAVATPLIRDPRATRLLQRIHQALPTPGDEMALESGILSLGSMLAEHLTVTAAPTHDAPLARRLRALLDDRLTETFTVAEAAGILGVHPSHLVRVFSDTYGISPHRYVTTRRIDRARRLLGLGVPASAAAVEVGFHDQAHMSRHFRRYLGATPGTFAA